MANQKQLAEHLDLTDRQVRNLLKDGVLPGSKGNGGLDLEAGQVAYIRYLRGLAAGQVKAETGIPEGDDINPLIEYRLMKERRGLTAAQRVGQEKKNDIAERRLVPVGFAIFALSRIAAQIGSTLDTEGQKVIRKYPDIELHHIEACSARLPGPETSPPILGRTCRPSSTNIWINSRRHHEFSVRYRCGSVLVDAA